MPHPFEIAAGIAGYSSVDQASENTNIGATEETVWTLGGVLTYLTAAEALKVVSGEAADDGSPAGTGARTVEVFGLDGDYAEISEIVTLNGTTAVATISTFLRVFKAIVRTVGSGGKNAGAISIKNNAAAVTHLIIDAGLNESLAAYWTVPADTELFLTRLWATEAANKKTKVRLYWRPYGEAFQVKETITLDFMEVNHLRFVPLAIPAKADIEIRAISAATGADVSAGFEGYYKTP